MSPTDEISREQLKALTAKSQCELDHLFFTRYFFKNRQNLKFRVNWHHKVMADAIEGVINGSIENLVVNVSPGATKTELFVINFIARGLALNPWARFLHLSGSDTLASLNSATARDLVLSDEYQAFWPLTIASDEKSKKRWNVEIAVDGKEKPRRAGGVYATSIGGQVTGFRAGHMAPGFQGAIIIDDPIKPEEAYSRPALELANRMLLTTVKSRKANQKTPIVLIMQRVAENDPSGFIEKGNVPGKWTHIKIPAILDESRTKVFLPKYQALIEKQKDEPDNVRVEVEGRFSYWPYKESIDELLEMEKGKGQDQNGQKISRYVYASQYDQNPVTLGGNIIHGKDFVRYRVLPKLKWRKVFGDTAQKIKERNDFSVFEEWGLGDDGRIYLLDLIKDRWEAPELRRRAVAFWARAKGRDVEKMGSIRKMMIEDKASGTGLIQELKVPPYNIPVEGIERGNDKLTRVMDIVSYIESGNVCIPEDAPFTLDFIQECEAFTADDTHSFDDQVDAMCDAITDMLGSGNKLKTWAALGKK